MNHCGEQELAFSYSRVICYHSDLFSHFICFLGSEFTIDYEGKRNGGKTLTFSCRLKVHMAILGQQSRICGPVFILMMMKRTEEGKEEEENCCPDTAQDMLPRLILL